MDSQLLLPETGYVRLPTVLKLIPVGRSTWFAGVASGRYPRSVKLAPRVTAWRAEDIRGLLEQFAKHSDLKGGGGNHGAS